MEHWLLIVLYLLGALFSNVVSDLFSFLVATKARVDFNGFIYGMVNMYRYRNVLKKSTVWANVYFSVITSWGWGIIWIFIYLLTRPRKSY